MNDLRSFYKGKKVFITGHTGFKGAWLSMFLIELGAEVIGYSLDPKTERDLFVEARIDELVTDIRGDIRNKSYLESKLIEHQPEIVFHLAAQPLVIESYINPYETWEINVMGTLNLLTSLRKLDSVKAVIVVTTDKVYKNTENNLGYTENDPLGGNDPYSSSKAAVEFAVEAWRKSFFTNNEGPSVGIATVRAGNVIGGGDWAENRLIPDYFRAYFASHVFELRNPNSVRPWQHVLDVLNGYLILGIRLYYEPSDYVGAWNFGPGIERKTTKEIINFINKDEDIVILETNNILFNETKLLVLDSGKSTDLLNWKNRISTNMTIDLTSYYYRNYITVSARKIVFEQIKTFLDSEINFKI